LPRLSVYVLISGAPAPARSRALTGPRRAGVGRWDISRCAAATPCLAWTIGGATGGRRCLIGPYRAGARLPAG